MQVNECVTTRPTVVGLRGSSTDHSEGAPVVDQGQSRRCNSVIPVIPDANPPRHLVTKLVEQNVRLKNLARQLIAERRQTVAQYLVCVHLCVLHLSPTPIAGYMT